VDPAALPRRLAAQTATRVTAFTETRVHPERQSSDLYPSEGSVAAPGAGLGSNSNYFLYNCGSILDLSVTINVTQDIVGTDGFGFQVNAYSATGDYDAAQQYVITMDPNGNLLAAVDNWQSGSTQLINDFVRMTALTGAKLPAGYSLTIALQNDTSGNVAGATYTAADNQCNTRREHHD
jgi:hypothetical protein